MEMADIRDNISVSSSLSNVSGKMIRECEPIAIFVF